MFGVKASRRTPQKRIVITITGENKSFVERVAAAEAQIRSHPDYYRPVHFVLSNRRSLAKYHDHFIYHYLEALSRTGDLPSSLLFAAALEITVTVEDGA